MFHFSAQLVVQALKEGGIIDRAVVYGLSINYERHFATLFTMIMDLSAPCTTVEDFGDLPLPEVVNYTIAYNSSSINITYVATCNHT